MRRARLVGTDPPYHGGLANAGAFSVRCGIVYREWILPIPIECVSKEQRIMTSRTAVLLVQVKEHETRHDAWMGRSKLPWRLLRPANLLV